MEMSTPPEFPKPVQIPGEPPPPREPREIDRPRVPDVVDDDIDLFGVEGAAARLTERLNGLDPEPAHPGADGCPLLAPPPTPARDRVEGPLPGRVTLVVYGAHAAPSSRSLGAVIDEARRRHLATVGIVWRHYPDPVAHPRAAVFALAVEAAAAAGRFWSLTRELLQLRRYDPGDLHGAMVRAGLVPDATLEAMRAGTGIERIASDVASALASGVTYAPALFVDGTRLRGDIEPGPVLAALDAALRA